MGTVAGGCGLVGAVRECGSDSRPRSNLPPAESQPHHSFLTPRSPLPLLTPHTPAPNTTPLTHRSRIDYTLVDAWFLREYGLSGPGLDVGRDLSVDPDSAEAALNAATLDGCFRPVEMNGVRQESEPQDYDHHLQRPPHTGMVYTPPQYVGRGWVRGGLGHRQTTADLCHQPPRLSRLVGCNLRHDLHHQHRCCFTLTLTPSRYSDHIAVSLLLDGRAVENVYDPGRTFNDPTTRLTQPHMEQREITAFFGGAEGGGGAPESAGNASSSSSGGASAGGSSSQSPSASASPIASGGSKRAAGGLAFPAVAKKSKSSPKKGKGSKPSPKGKSPKGKGKGSKPTSGRIDKHFSAKPPNPGM